jgi:hypothetical protein
MAILLDEADDDLTDELGQGLADETDDALTPFISVRQGTYVPGAETVEGAVAGANKGIMFTPGASAAEVGS